MGDLLAKLLELLQFLRPHRLVTRQGGLSISCLFALLVSLACYESQASPLTWTIAVPSSLLAAILAWWVAREAYFRIGLARKIGIAYNGHRVPYDDWHETKRQICVLFRDSPAARRVRLVHVPPSRVETDTAWKTFQERYHFAAVLQIEVSAPTAGGGKPSFEATLNAAFRANLREDFVNQITNLMRALFIAPEDAPNMIQLIKKRAQGLFEPIVLFLATRDGADGNFEESARLLEHLDSRLTSRLPVDRDPRRGVRWLRCLSLLQPSAFPQTTLPVGDELKRAFDLGRIAVNDYGREFPFTFHSAARTAYFYGEVDQAFRITESALSGSLPSELEFINLLNRAVLNLFRCNWIQSHTAFVIALRHKRAVNMNWGHLVEFADAAFELGEQNACYLCCMYRAIARTEIPQEIKDSASDWLGMENSRQPLRYLLNAMIDKGLAGIAQTSSANGGGRKRRSK